MARFWNGEKFLRDYIPTYDKIERLEKLWNVEEILKKQEHKIILELNNLIENSIKNTKKQWIPRKKKVTKESKTQRNKKEKVIKMKELKKLQELNKRTINNVLLKTFVTKKYLKNIKVGLQSSLSGRNYIDRPDNIEGLNTGKEAERSIGIERQYRSNN